MAVRHVNGDAGELFSIGQMARLFHLNVRTLRYYDQIGLLKPELVDKQTRYRYYSSAQFERLNTILYLRALDVPIERIARFFDGREVELMRGIFEDQLDEVRRKRHELELVERKIMRRIAQIDRAQETPRGKVELVSLGERRFVALAERFLPSDDLEPLIRDLSSRAYLDDAIFLGKVGVSLSLEDLRLGAFSELSSVFILVEEEDAYLGTTGVLPSGRYACVQFEGTHRDAGPYYRLLLERIAQMGLEPCGDSVEVTLIDAGMTSDESQFVTEIQIPCRAV